MTPRLPRLSSKKVISLLKKKGFEFDHVTGSHYVFYRASDNRRATVPFHTKDLAIGTLLSILDQAGIDRKNLY
jgi:predicted RNA binding protein YcfA (HicA-like mRNA interferase family)